MERLMSLVGRGSRITERVREALRLGLRIRRDRPQRPPSRDPACRLEIQRVRGRYLVAHLVLNRMVALPRLDGSAVFRPNKPVDRRRELTPRKVFGLIGASPHQ